MGMLTFIRSKITTSQNPANASISSPELPQKEESGGMGMLTFIRSDKSTEGTTLTDQPVVYRDDSDGEITESPSVIGKIVYSTTP
jgi:hypothetical protein